MSEKIKIRAEFELPKDKWDLLAEELKTKGILINMGLTELTIPEAVAFAVLQNHEVIDNE